VKRQTPLLLIVGSPTSCEVAARTLREDGLFADGEILTRFRVDDALALLQGRADIGIVLLLWENAETATLPDVLSSLAAAHSDGMRPIMVRSRTALPRSLRNTLCQLGAADRLFAQPTDAPEFADSLATVMRDHTRIEALTAVNGAAARLEQIQTLWELAELILALIHERGIAGTGALFCLLGGSAEPRLMTVAGTGRYRDIGCLPVDHLDDLHARGLLLQARTQRCSQFTGDAATLYVETTEGDVACIYLVLDGPLPAWQRRLLALLSNAFSIAIGKNQAAHRLLRTQHATVSTMATLAEYRDVDTGEHVARVARHVTEITQVLADRGQVDDAELIGQIGLAAILHDIGKIAIPEAVLLKPAALDAAERRMMEMHAGLGRDILMRAAARSDNAGLLRRAAEIAYSHHEKYDGTGYPAGLKGEHIPLAARIVALVDVFDALTSLRPYKEPWPYEKAVETIVAGSGSHFDPDVVEAFLWLEERRKAADFFVWDESMSVGNPELDVDHKRLIGIINRLWVAEDNGNRQVIEFVLDDLVHYTEVHFKREEDMMDRGDYPDFQRHRRIHQAICQRLEEIRWEYFQGIREELRGEILEFLKDWLNEHILVEDMRYRPYLPKWAAKLTP
jgi:hemerythrin-like metal-binding protein